MRLPLLGCLHGPWLVLSLTQVSSFSYSGEFFLTQVSSFSYSGEFFLSQSAQSSLSFLAHVLSPQKAFGIQSSQNVTAKDGCKVL